MTALELIKNSAILLNVKEILEDESLNNLNTENCNDCLDNNFALNRFFEILKIMLNELSSEYVPIIKENTFISEDKKIDLSNIENFMKVCHVSIDRVPVKYKVVDKKIITNFDGVFNVKFMAYPKIETLLDSVEVFDRGVGEDLLVYGVVALYCLAVGLTDEFSIYHNIYSEKLSALQNLKIIDMPCRRWE